MKQKFLNKIYDLTYSIMFGAIAAILLITIGNNFGVERNIETMYFLTTVLSISRIALTVIKFFMEEPKV